MVLGILLILAGLPGMSAPTAQASASYKDAAGPFRVATLSLDWFDQQRNREVPVKIYYPSNGAGPFPVIVFSHGLGGSREGYAYLGRHWASYGYVVAHVQHHGSDAAVLKDAPLGGRMQALTKAAHDPQNAVNRPRDISFAIDQMIKMNSDPGPLEHRLDLARLGVSGHSFGGFTTLAVAGEAFPLPAGSTLKGSDARVKAALAMSVPVPQDCSRWDEAFVRMNVPVSYMTGTRDNSPIGETRANDRRAAMAERGRVFTKPGCGRQVRGEVEVGEILLRAAIKIKPTECCGMLSFLEGEAYGQANHQRQIVGAGRTVDSQAQG